MRPNRGIVSDLLRWLVLITAKMVRIIGLVAIGLELGLRLGWL